MGAGGIKSLGAAKTPMSMGDILDVLVSKAKLEAEDAQRVLLGALNGLAALMLLDTGPTQTALAIKTYREVTCSSQDASLSCMGMCCGRLTKVCAAVLECCRCSRGCY